MINSGVDELLKNKSLRILALLFLDNEPLTVFVFLSDRPSFHEENSTRS